MINLLAPEFYI